MGDAECACQFACPPGLVGVQINRRCRHRGMAQVVPNGRQRRSLSQRVGRVRMTHPMRAGSPQFFGQCGVDGCEICRALTEESLEHRPQPRTREADAIVSQAGNQWRRRRPLGRRNSDAASGQIPVQCELSRRRHRHTLSLVALAHDRDPSPFFSGTSSHSLVLCCGGIWKQRRGGSRWQWRQPCEQIDAPVCLPLATRARRLGLALWALMSSERTAGCWVSRSIWPGRHAPPTPAVRT